MKQSLRKMLPFTCHPLWFGAGWHVGGSVARSLQHVVEGDVERQSRAHPQKHVGAQFVAGGPKVIFRITGVFQILRHRVGLLLRFEGRQLETQRAAILIRQEVVEFRTVGIHSRDEILYAIQLDRCDSLGCKDFHMSLIRYKSLSAICIMFYFKSRWSRTIPKHSIAARAKLGQTS